MPLGTMESFSSLVVSFPSSSYGLSTFLLPFSYNHPRCGHCVKLDPVLDEVVATVRDSLRIGKVRVHASLLSTLPTSPLSLAIPLLDNEAVGTFFKSR